MLEVFATSSGRLFHAVTIIIPMDFCLINLDNLCRYTLSEYPQAACLCATYVQSLINDVVSES